jgi:hypothetical protein
MEIWRIRLIRFSWPGEETRMFKLNRLISEYRIKVEHAICELKCHKVMGTRRRHPRPKLKNLVKICSGR